MVPPAELLFATKFERWGGIVQVRIWRLPGTSPERPHGLKYSLFFGQPGKRIIGYDNEAGKGDHRHYLGLEEPYEFESIGKLLADFLTDVDGVKSDDGT